MLGSCASEIPRLYTNEPSSLLPIGWECPIFHGVGSMPCAMLRHIKYRLIRTHVYSIESKDRLKHFGVTVFLYRIIGDGRNTAVLGVLTMNSELFYKYIKKLHTITIRILFADFDFSFHSFAMG